MRHLFCAVFAACSALALANDSQILEVYDTSLTTVQFTSGSGVQDVLPQHFHRGVHIDGSIKEEPLFAWAVAGNPWTEEWNSRTHFGSVRLDVGAYSTTEVDMALPAEGFSWVVGRTYNSRQHDGTSHHDSDGYQGWNWFQTSQPEIVVIDDDGNDELTDMVYLIYGADRFLEFKRATDGENPSPDTFRGVNGTAGAIKVTTGSPDLYVYHDQNGMEVTFFGGNTASSQADWQMWKMEDPAGNVAYIGSTTASTAVTTGYHSDGRIKLAYDTEGRKYTYSYGSFGTSTTYTRLTEVKAEEGATLIQKVEYDYYEDAEDCTTNGPQHGEAGDLKSVTITTPLSQSGKSLVETTYYRYWTAADYSTTEGDCYNPGDAHLLKMVVGPEGVRKYDYGVDSAFNDDQEDASDETLMPYSDAYFTYHQTTNEIETAAFDGECGCSGGVNGTHAFTYDTDDDYTDDAGYDTDGGTPERAIWAYRTVIDPPDGTETYHTDEAWYTQYFDEVGQPLSSLRTKINPATTTDNTYWFSHVYRDSNGCITEIGSASHSNANETGGGDYDHDDGGNPDGSFTLDDDATTGNEGLVYQFTRAGSGDYTGFATNQTYTEWYATSDPEYLLWSRTFFVDGTNSYHKKTVGDFDVVRPLLDDRSVYATFETSVGTNAQKTEYDYSFHEALVIETITTDEPDVTTGYAPTTVQWKDWYGDDGDLLWAKDPIGTITYHEYTDGQQTRLVEDADTGVLGTEGVTIPNGLSSSGTLHRETEWDYDDQGRITDTTLASGRVAKSYYTLLADRRAVALEIPRVTSSGSTTYYGPAAYAVYNLVGETVASATIAVDGGSTTTGLDSWIDETKSDVIQAFSLGGSSSLSSLTTRDYSDNGRKLTDEHLFHVDPLPSSISAADHEDYDRTGYEYNHMGLIDGVTHPSGTQIYREYTSHGQLNGQGIRAEARGNTMPTQPIIWISDGNHGNSHDTAHPGQGGGDDGGGPGGGDYGGGPTAKWPAITEWGCWKIALNPVSTTIARSPRNHQRFVEAASGPVYLFKYDNLGRVVAVGVYDADSSHGFGSGGWQTADPTTSATGRMALYEVFYDARGNRYKTTGHEIDPADGSDDDSLDLLTWVDAFGREIKHDGEQLTKRAYDALGRVTGEYVLAKDNDTTYAHAEDVAGDTVLEQSTWAYDLMDNGLLASRVDRYYDSGTGTTGALDSNADGDDLKVTAANLSGRAQITTSWYDELDRLTDTGEYGTNGGSDLDRDGLSIPTRPTTGVLLTSYTFDDAGRRHEMTDPLGSDTRWEFDSAGRTTEIVRNYVDGNAGGGTLDDEDLITEFVYVPGTSDTNGAIYGTGQLSQIKAQQAGATTQVTTYTYGITSGSDITAGHLLQSAAHPDSSGGTDAIAYDYNGALLVSTITDQEGATTDIDYDFAKRETGRTFDVSGSDLDDRISSIDQVYDALGRLQTVTQYEETSVADEVEFTYDGWGNIEHFEQDLNSAVNADAYDLTYDYTKRTAGRNAVIRSSLTYPDGTVVSLDDGSSTDINRQISYHAARIDRVRVNTGSGAVTVANYEFLGINRVVGTKHPFTGGDVHSYQYGSTSGSYPDLDQFNRITTSRWSKVRSSGSPLDWYQEIISNDNNSNITHTEHGFFDALDALFTVDDLDRITDVEVGDYASGSVTNDRLGEVWDLTQLGNWSHHKLDLNGNGTYTDTNEFDDKRTFNLANEMTDRDLDTDGDSQHDDANYDLIYDDLGNLTDDGENYKFIYDIRGQLVEVTDQSDATIAEFRYNGLGYLISKRFDVDAGGTLENDEWRHFVYDEQWRVVAVYRGTDEDSAENDPKERYVYHAAGQDGVGSYIDDLILRDRDAVQPSGSPSNTDPTKTWEYTGDGTLEERVFFCQNWRADVVLVLDDDGDIAQRAWYSPYGVPTGCDPADLNADGVTNTQDTIKFLAWHAASDARADWNVDGSVNTQDTIAYLAAHAAAQTFGGRGVLSSAELDVRSGYAGYRWDEHLDKYHVRHRVYDPYSGRWINRDPIGYRAGPLNLLEYAGSNPILNVDSDGLLIIVRFPREKARPNVITRSPKDFIGCPGQVCGSKDELIDAIADSPSGGLACWGGHGNEDIGPYWKKPGGVKEPWFDPADLTDDEVETLQKKDGYIIWCCNVGDSQWLKDFEERIDRPVYGPSHRVTWPYLDPQWPRPDDMKKQITKPSRRPWWWDLPRYIPLA